MRKVPFNNLGWIATEHGPALLDGFEKVLNSSHFVLGEEVRKFEKNFAAYLGAPLCHGVANGTDALEIALRSLPVGSNAKVGTVANAGFYSSTAILCAGLAPHYMEVAEETQLVTAKEAEKAIENGVQALIITHLFGNPVPESEKIKDLCVKNNVWLIEDCAQAHGASINKQKTGTFGDLACFSFYPTKNLGALGDAGCIVVNTKVLDQRVVETRQYGWGKKYEIQDNYGKNSRLDELQAAFLNRLLPHLDIWNDHRKAVSAKYRSEIKNKAIAFHITDPNGYVAHLFVLRSARRDKLRSFLLENGIQSEVHYPLPDHHQTPMKHKQPGLTLPTTERLSKEVLSIPCHPGISEEDSDYVVGVINQFE